MGSKGVLKLRFEDADWFQMA